MKADDEVRMREIWHDSESELSKGKVQQAGDNQSEVSGESFGQCVNVCQYTNFYLLISQSDRVSAGLNQ